MKPYPKPAKSKKKSVSEATLWRWFSIYIRLRDANDQGYCRCIVSGNLIHWKECDAGHFISRRHKNTKYDEQNVHAQGRQSNRFKSGEQFAMGIIIDKKYGAGTAAKIYNRSLITRKFSSFEIEAMTKHYKTEAKKIAMEKGLLI